MIQEIKCFLFKITFFLKTFSISFAVISPGLNTLNFPARSTTVDSKPILHFPPLMMILIFLKSSSGNRASAY